MPRKSWHLDRRTFLAGAGVSLALPLLEGMAVASQPARPLPTRLFCGYFPFGVVVMPETSENAEWGWWPIGSGRDFRLSNTLAPLQDHRDDVTFFHGFQHNRVNVGGHNSANFFLTGANTRGEGNTISLDQAAAAQIGDTRIQSLTLSTDGGVGSRDLSHTLSYTSAGRPIPALANPIEIFERLFGAVNGRVRRNLELDRSILDGLMESSRSLERQLGQADRRTLDEYLGSVRTLETDVRRAQTWLDATRIPVDRSEFTLDTHPGTDPRTYLRAMYDLVFHAFRTDTTRVATYQTGSMSGAASVADRWPFYMGGGTTAHLLAHAAQRAHVPKSRYDAALLEPFARFIARLKETREGEGTLLDRTVLLYGSSNSRTHVNSNYPLVLAGGRSLGLRHGQYVKNPRNRPMADILLTMLQAVGAPAQSFADSSGPIADLRA